MVSDLYGRLFDDFQGPEFAVAYWGADTQVKLVWALELVRRSEGMSVDELERRMEGQRTTFTQPVATARSNPTLETFIALLRALDVTAEVHLRPAREGEPPVIVDVDVSQPVPD
jgi:hypothetical protein